MKNPMLKKALAVALGASLAVSIPVMAASGNETVADGSYTKTVKVVNDGRDDNESEWNDYELAVTLKVDDGKITSITAEPGDGYIEDNDSYLGKAFNKKKGINTLLTGQAATAKMVEGWDTVSSATLTSAAAKQAVLDLIADAPAAAKDDSKDDAATEGVYVLMNIPYASFYGAEGTKNLDADAMSSATNKVGNTGKAGGGYHDKATAKQNEDGTYTAVGGENGANMLGVTWPVKAADMETVQALGGTEVTDETTVVVATLGKGQTSSNEVTGAQALMEAPSYSYYALTEEPANYLELTVTDGNATFAAAETNATKLDKLDVNVSYGTNWGDIQLDFDTPEAVNGKQLNAMVLTAEDGTTAGMVHLYNAWANNSIAWSVTNTPGLDGKKLTNIRYYVNDKEGSYEVYDVPVDADIVPVFRGEVKASFTDQTTVTVNGLPDDIKNARAKVYHTTGGRGAVLTYLTPEELDESDGDIDPVDEKMVGNTIPLNHESNKAENGLEYQVIVSSDNYAPIKTTATFGAAEEDDSKSDDSKQDDSKSDDSKQDDSNQDDSKGDTKTDDNKQDDSKTDDSKSDDTKQDEPTVLNGIVKGPDGKWAKYVDNKVDKDYTGIAKNQYGWWRIVDGYVDFDANEIYKNEYGWWKCTDGKVTFDETGIFKNDYGWWRVVDSKVDFNADGIYRNQYGWWKTTGGKVTFKENGIFRNEYGWWKVENSKVNFKYTGKVVYNGKAYNVKNGKVV